MDAEIPGFGVKVTPRGSRIYVLQYSQRNRDRRMTIGRHGDGCLTADLVRREAEIWSDDKCSDKGPLTTIFFRGSRA